MPGNVNFSLGVSNRYYVDQCDVILCVVVGKQCLKVQNSTLRSMSVAAQPKTQEKTKPKTGILMLNMGGPSTTDKVGEYLHRIMTDRDMIQLPVQRFVE